MIGSQLDWLTEELMGIPNAEGQTGIELRS